MTTKVQVFAGAISLVALLIYTLVHTGGLLADYVEPWFVGYIAAFGIELAVVSLSLRIGDLKRNRQDFRFFMFVLIAVVVVSALANIAEGFSVAHDADLTFDTVRDLDIIQATIGLTATGLISLIVLALSEIIGTDVQAIVKEAIKEQRKAEREQSETTKADSLTEANETRAKTAIERKALTLQLLAENPERPPKEIKALVGIKNTTYYDYLNEFKEVGAVRVNGDRKIQVINPDYYGGDQ